MWRKRGDTHSNFVRPDGERGGLEVVERVRAGGGRVDGADHAHTAVKRHLAVEPDGFCFDEEEGNRSLD